MVSWVRNGWARRDDCRLTHWAPADPTRYPSFRDWGRCAKLYLKTDLGAARFFARHYPQAGRIMARSRRARGPNQPAQLEWPPACGEMNQCGLMNYRQAIALKIVAG